MIIKDLSKMSDEEIKQNIVSWISNVTTYMERQQVPSWIRDYENLLQYNARRYLVLRHMDLQWQYNPHSKTDLISRAYITFSGMLRKLDLRKVKASSYVGKEYTKTASEYEKYVQWLYSDKENKDAINSAIDEALLTGNGFLKIMRRKERKKIVQKYTKDKITKSIKENSKDVDVDKPIIKYVSIFDAIVDPYNLDRIVGERTLMTEKEINELYEITDKQRDKIKDNARYWNNNYNKVKEIKSFENIIVTQAQECDNIQKAIMSKQISKETDFYKIGDDIFEVIDVYVDVKNSDGRYETHQAVIINQELIYFGPSPYAFDGSPIVHFKYIGIPGAKFGIGLGELGANYQSEADRLQETKMIAINMLSNPMFSKDAEVGRQKKTNQKFEYKARGFIESIPGAANAGITPIRVIDPSNISVLSSELIQVKADFAAKVGLNPYTEGGTGGIERSSAGANLRSQASNNKIAEFIENISFALSDIAEKCALLMKAHGKDIELDMQDGTEDIAMIKIDEISNGYKITFDADDILGTKEAQLNTLVQTLQYAQSFDKGQDIDFKGIVEQMFELRGLHGLIKNNDEKLKEAEEELKYQVQLQELRAKYIPPTGPEVKPADIRLSMNLGDINEMTDDTLKKELLSKVGVNYEPPQQEPPQMQQIAPNNIIGQAI